MNKQIGHGVSDCVHKTGVAYVTVLDQILNRRAVES